MTTESTNQDETFSISFSTFKTFDKSTFEILEETDNCVKQTLGMLPMHIGAVAYLSGYVNEERPLETFPLNAEGLPWVEKYLEIMVKPYVTKWRKDHFPAEAKPNDLADENCSPQEALRWAHMRLMAAGAVYGQCLAQEFGLKWKQDNKAPMEAVLVSHETTCIQSPWQKPTKFCRFGEEDSLVQMVPIIRNYSKALDGIKQIREDMEKRNPGCLKNLARIQPWFSPEGKLVEIRFLDKKEKVITGAYIVDDDQAKADVK
jgi:hypothetical protein